jgi:hypothetical protein
MYLRQLVEDYNFEDVAYFYENDKYFVYLSARYKLTDEDIENFNKLKNNSLEYNKYSLDVITLRKEGLLPMVYLRDKDDELEKIKGKSLEELSTYAVDLDYSRNERKSFQLILILLLENSYYLKEDHKKSSVIEGSVTLERDTADE